MLDAPRSAGSSDGNRWPMSSMPAAPSSASVTAWLTRSASECPSRPRSAGIVHAGQHERAALARTRARRTRSRPAGRRRAHGARLGAGAGRRRSVILRLRPLAGDGRHRAGRPPRPATAQSVASRSSSAGRRERRRSAAARNACGVCTAAQLGAVERLGHQPVAHALDRVGERHAGTAPSCVAPAPRAPGRPAPATRAAGRRRGRGSSPASAGDLLQPGRDRVRPRRAARPRPRPPCPPPARRPAASPAPPTRPGTTSTIRSTAGCSSSRSIECASSGRPPSPTNAFGRSAPSRVPSPAGDHDRPGRAQFVARARARPG